ncbi:hypothetical protein Asulf_00342 [Archaeoglobus sulfaticallidus PM70-1]|uniref:Uncharacterized protein n=1 Tax=Archaeoglobus sulfaticallidus PM70-1 TaxID=387631 RepID=N0B9V2_9EURY|nr:hypothetical protein [Archaeoglobus sulfaticallidus]AGK60374.1 hypothetical protein Asulf_00342 [Archaeoglobus sulfaticallidus PM70-1]
MSFELELVALFATFFLNLPFGYWRKNTKKFSLEWFLSIHLPVPFVFLMRIFSRAPLTHIPIFFLVFFSGQFLGGKIWERVGYSKCLVVDVVRQWKGVF